jgi:hypothetical protein
MTNKEDPIKRAKAYRGRAEEIVTLADRMKDETCRVAMLRIAASYETMARTAEHTSSAIPQLQREEPLRSRAGGRG